MYIYLSMYMNQNVMYLYTLYARHVYRVPFNMQYVARACNNTNMCNLIIKDVGGVVPARGEPPEGGVATLPTTFSGVACCGSCPRSLRDLRMGL